MNMQRRHAEDISVLQQENAELSGQHQSQIPPKTVVPQSSQVEVSSIPQASHLHGVTCPSDLASTSLTPGLKNPFVSGIIDIVTS